MADLALARRLTEGHRRAQLGLSALAIRELVQLWPTLDPTRLEETFPRYASAAAALVASRRESSSRLAAAYYQEHRRALVKPGATPVAAALVGALDRDKLIRDLEFAGPIAARKTMSRGITRDRAMRAGLSATAGVLTRYALEGSRETLVSTAQRDPLALGFVRVTDGQPCAFCAMLAGRGAVYFSEETASFEPHNRCGCQPEAVFDESTPLPGAGGDYAALYEQVKAEKGSTPTLQEFRRAYEAPSS